MADQQLTKDILTLHPEEEVDKITSRIRELLSKQIKRRGIVVALSGGIDSSVTTALAVKAIGGERVIVLLMPEQHSAEETLKLSNMVADHFGVDKIQEDITDILTALGFYKRYDNAVKTILPEYGEGWRSKIVIPDIAKGNELNFFSIVAKSPDGHMLKKRLPLKAYLEIVAATNFKQRTRKMLEYYHADRMNYAVAGTPNRLEYDQGFFVKLGDGAADIKPIAHLYKSQVYQLAEFLDVPEEVRKRPPTTDTYSLPQGQDEFYFSLPYDQMDICLYSKNNDIPAETAAAYLSLTEDQVNRVYADIDQKRKTTRYLHLQPLLVDDIPEV